MQTKDDLHLVPAADDLAVPGAQDNPEFAPTDESRRIVAGDLARKHGISIDRAGMLVDRLGSNRHTLDGAAQTLRDRAG